MVRWGRNAIAAGSFVASSTVAMAQSAIALQPTLAFPKTEVETTHSYTGGCGAVVVRVVGVTNAAGEVFQLDMDGGRVVLHQSRGPDLVIDGSNGLSDFNGVACVENNGSSRLLIWSKCGGTACGDDYAFAVVDPDKMKIVSPDNGCDEMCAYALTGSRLPWTLNHKRMP